jgi:PAS domain S-box-containing protein
MNDTAFSAAQLAELTRLRERLRSVLETASVYILELDPNGVIRYVNRVHSGLSTEQVVGSHILNWMPPNARPQMQDAIAAVLRGERRVEVVIQGTGSDGGDAWYRTCIGPLEIDGRIEALTMLSEDITEQRRAQIDRERQAKLAALGRVSAAIAHDYNTLFTTMLCSLDAIRDVADQPQQLREELATLETAISGAAELTQHLTRVSHHRESNSERCDLSAGVREIAPLLERVAGKLIELHYELGPGPYYAALSMSDLSQLMLNLITNSREAMPEGGRVTVTLSAKGPAINGTAGEALLRVSDTGPGIPDEFVQHLFEPYFSTKNRGSGFGLATCYGIAARAGGEIRASRAAGGGAQLEVRLPLYETALVAAQPPEHVPATTAGNGTVLLVDDSAELRATLRRHLSRAGYYVLLGCDGRDALEVLHRHPGHVDLVISDLVLTGGSGIALLDTLQKERPALRALALTSQAADSALGWLRDHNVPVLRKPFSARELENRVRELLS